MSLLCHLHRLEEEPLFLDAELSVAELNLDTVDELIRVVGPVTCHLHVQLLGRNILVKGDIHVTLQCECVRCLRPFQRELDLSDWTCLLSLDGEDKVNLIGECVDLTPWVREDIFLALPAHPLCGLECVGLADASRKHAKQATTGSVLGLPSAWAELNKLKL